MSQQEPITKNPTYSLSDYDGLFGLSPDRAVVAIWRGEEGELLCLEVRVLTPIWENHSLN